MPGGTWPPWRPRSVAWMVATSGTSHSVFSVSPAQATSQSWACTTSGRQSPSRAASCDELVVGRGHAGHEVVLGQPRQVGRGAQHAHAVDHLVVGHRVGAGLVPLQAEHDHVVADRAPSPGPGRRRGRRCRRSTNGGYSHDSITTRIAATVALVPAGLHLRSSRAAERPRSPPARRGHAPPAVGCARAPSRCPTAARASRCGRRTHAAST